MHVRFLAVIGLFLILTVVMAVRQHIVIVGVGMPESSVVPLVERVVRVVMRDMEVVVTMRLSGVRVLRFLTLTLCTLKLAGARGGLHMAFSLCCPRLADSVPHSP